MLSQLSCLEVSARFLADFLFWLSSSVTRSGDISPNPRFEALDFGDFSAIWGRKTGDFRDLGLKTGDSAIWAPAPRYLRKNFWEHCSKVFFVQDFIQNCQLQFLRYFWSPFHLYVECLNFINFWTIRDRSALQRFAAISNLINSKSKINRGILIGWGV